MRVLLTGSSGWLARFLAPRLMLAGHRVIGLDVVPGAATNVVGSVAERSVVDRVFADHGIEAVIHAGALHKPDIARFPPQAFIDVNVTGTLNLLQAAAGAGHDRFVFTSTTSLMISQAIRDGGGAAAVWLDESTGPLEPRNIYGVTKLAAEGLCRLFSREHGLNCAVLRTSRFFPEEDDTIRDIQGENLKATELLYRRLTVEDAAEAHLAALENASGFEIFVIGAPTPFARGGGTPARLPRERRFCSSAARLAHRRAASIRPRSRLCLADHEACKWLIFTASSLIWSHRSIPPAMSEPRCWGGYVTI